MFKNNLLRFSRRWAKPSTLLKRYSKVRVYILSSFLLLPAAAMQAQEVGRTAVSLGISTVGLKGEIAYRPNENWRLRGMLSGAPSYRSSEELGGINYDTTASILGVSLLADHTLWGSNFYLTLGAFISGSDAKATATGTFQIGNNVYSTTLNGRAEFENRVSPIIALGYDWEMDRNWVFTGSLGYLYTGGMNVSLSGAGVLPGDIALEELDVEADIDDGYPFIELGFRYQF